MRTAWAMLLVLAAAFALVVTAQAEEKKADKEQTLKGTITCAKCDLKKEDKCTTVIVVKEKDKDVVYYLDPKSGKDNHETICKGAKKGTVTGTVSKEGDKMVVKVSKIEFDK